MPDESIESISKALMLVWAEMEVRMTYKDTLTDNPQADAWLTAEQDRLLAAYDNLAPLKFRS